MDEPSGGAAPDQRSSQQTATGREEPPGVPGWVKLMAVGFAVLVVVAVVLMFLLGGDHGPGRHAG